MRAVILALVTACSSSTPQPDAPVVYQPVMDAGATAPASQSDGTCLYEQPICGAACSRMGLCYVGVAPGCQCACLKC